MKIALVHDYLNQYGGAERVLEALLELFPTADLYTLFHDPERTANRFVRFVKGTSAFDLPFIRRNHRAFIPLLPTAAKTMSLADYDIVISDSAGYAKGIDTGAALHISYCHTPLRYAWETGDYVQMKFPGLIGKVVSAVVAPVAAYLRAWDKKAARNPHLLLTNSQFIQEKIKNYYGRGAAVLYPPVDIHSFSPDRGQKILGERYFLAVGRLLHYKRFDLIIDAFKALHKKIKIVGSGPELKKLKRRARGAGNIEFIPFLNNEKELRVLYANAEALIFPQVEDFGLTAAESLACGTPVIAYKAGGAREIVEEGETGWLFEEQSKEGIVKAVRAFEKMHFDRAHIRARALRFSKERFKKELLRTVEEAWALRKGQTLQSADQSVYSQAI